MKRSILVLSVLIFAIFGQTSDRFSAYTVDTDPAPIPASLSAVFTFTLYVEEITLTNKTAMEVTVTIQDRQTPARDFMRDVPIAPNDVLVIRMNGRKFPGGLSWSASTADAVIGYVQGRR
ncbi:MAG TPA: hypothetical protein VKV15_03005 [Bryobacteraceae bacterium]|nr:hypothetical protein [Bryobacteraceae bacterium]